MGLGVTDPTTPLPRFVTDPAGSERRLLFALFVAYLFAGAVLAFALLELEAVADQITNAPLCRRL